MRAPTSLEVAVLVEGGIRTLKRLAAGQRVAAGTSGSSTRGRSTTRSTVYRVTENNTKNVGLNEEEETPREQYFDMRRWPAKEHDMICGDVNAHSPLWDDKMVDRRTDKRGRII